MADALRLARRASSPIFIFPFLTIPRKRRLDLKSTLSFSIWGWDVANPIWRKAMKNVKKRFETVSKRIAAMVTLAILTGGSGVMKVAAQGSAILVRPERQVATVQSK